jgi:hypothetical protein
MDPTRLLEDELDDFERALLRSARVDEPDVHAIARAAVVLGVGTSTLTLAAGTAAASAVPAGSTAVGAFGKLGVLGVVKWLSIGVVSGLVTTSGVEIARTTIGSGNHEDPAAVDTAEPVAKLPRAHTASALSPIPVPPVTADTIAADEIPPPSATFAAVPALATNVTPAKPGPGPVARSASSPPVAVPAASSARTNATQATTPATIAVPTATFALPAASTAHEAPKVASIAEETAMLERARRALASGNSTTALSELDTYEQRARARALGTEASVLRVESLLQAGQRASAVALAQRLLAAQPHGAHANRLRSIVASSSP